MSQAGGAQTIPVIEGLGVLADRYDGFIVDLWGVIHGGVEPYPGVIETLERLRTLSKPVALLSNAPRRSAAAERRLHQIGVGRHLYRRLVTSGEVAHMALRDRADSEHAELGRTYLYIGPPVDEDLLADLDFAAVDRPEQAGFLLCVGLFDEADPLERYDPLFERAVARGAPMVCVNPDLWVHRQNGVTSPCAGLLAERYHERHGGRVIYHGKPDPRVFHAAADALELDPGARLLVIGDSLTTDIRGAARAGFDSLFVTRGIFARDLGIEPGEVPPPDRVADLCNRHGERPVAATPTLRW